MEPSFYSEKSFLAHHVSEIQMTYMFNNVNELKSPKSENIFAQTHCMKITMTRVFILFLG